MYNASEDAYYGVITFPLHSKGNDICYLRLTARHEQLRHDAAMRPQIDNQRL